MAGGIASMYAKPIDLQAQCTYIYSAVCLKTLFFFSNSEIKLRKNKNTSLLLIY